MLSCNVRGAKNNDKWQKKIVIKVTTGIKQFAERFYFFKPRLRIRLSVSLLIPR